MDTVAKRILMHIYQQSAIGDAQIRYSANLTEKVMEQAAIKQLVENGYIINVTSDLGGAICRLTSSGESFAKSL